MSKISLYKEENNVTESDYRTKKKLSHSLSRLAVSSTNRGLWGKYLQHLPEFSLSEKTPHNP